MINFLFGLTVGFLVGVAATIYFAFHESEKHDDSVHIIIDTYAD